MKGKFYFIRKRDIDKLRQLFESKDTDLKVVLNQFGDFSDVAAYSEKYDTVVFTTVKSDTIKSRL